MAAAQAQGAEVVQLAEPEAEQEQQLNPAPAEPKAIVARNDLFWDSVQYVIRRIQFIHEQYVDAPELHDHDWRVFADNLAVIKTLAPQNPTLKSWEVADFITSSYLKNKIAEHKVNWSAVPPEVRARRVAQRRQFADVLSAPVSPELVKAFDQELKSRGLKTLPEILKAYEPNVYSSGCLYGALLIALLMSLSFWLIFEIAPTVSRYG